MSAENTDGLITIDDEIIDDFDVDLTEFATALRTFPDTILKAVLGIYHKQGELHFSLLLLLIVYGSHTKYVHRGC